jgi:hypothetical protein
VGKFGCHLFKPDSHRDSPPHGQVGTAPG